MFKRFPSQKSPAPFPPIEEDMRCPKCGFNHTGWAFEPGFAKLCVKCGTVLEAAQETESSDEPHGDAQGPGFLGRLFKGMFGGRPEAPVHEGSGRARQAADPQVEAHAEPRIGGEDFPEGVETVFQSAGSEEEVDHDTEREGSDAGAPHDQPRDLEAARVGACKRQGRLLAAQGRFEEAAAMLEKVVAFEPNDVDAWGELGRIHYTGTGNLTRSIQCSRKALEIDGDLASVKCTLCLALLFDGQFDLAKKGFLEVIRSVRKSRNSDEAFQENCKALLQDCLGELYASKKQSSGELLARIREIIELLEIEKIYFH